MTPDPETVARHYVRELSGPNWEDAYHHLLEMGEEAVRVLGDEFRNEPDGDVRQMLVRVLGQSRSDQAVPVLSEALEDHRPGVWKEAVDGFVTIGSKNALNGLLQFRQRVDMSKASWLDEAITQVRERNSPDKAD